MLISAYGRRVSQSVGDDDAGGGTIITSSSSSVVAVVALGVGAGRPRLAVGGARVLCDPVRFMCETIFLLSNATKETTTLLCRPR